MSSTESPQGSKYDFEDKGAGWIVFCATILGFSGILSVINGITAATKSPFHESSARYVFSGSTTWGWIMIIVGGITILAAFSLFRAERWARTFGIVIAGLSAITALLGIQNYPFWSLCVFALNVLVVYGLAVYGKRGLDI